MATQEQNPNEELGSFLDLDLASVPEMGAVPDGDYEISVERYKRGTSQKGENYILLFFEIPSEPTAKSFSNYYGLGAPDDDTKQRNEKLDRFRTTLDTFGVDYSSGINLDDLIGRTAWATLGTKHDEQYGAQNVIRTLQKPR